MKYQHIKEAIFLHRPNRFIAHILIHGQEELAHVKNTGRCKELLIPGCTIYVEEHDNPNRKTKYSLIGVKKGNILINMDSQAPNKVVGEWLAANHLFPTTTLIKAEQTYKHSRFDFYVETPNQKIFLEVKGVTLEENKVARFPDAPTTRGIKHMEELIDSINDGYEAYLIFVIQMKGIQHFEPNDQTHKAFGDTLRKAKKAGVHILALDCLVAPDELTIDQQIPIIL